MLRRYLRLKGAILWLGALCALGAFMGFPATGKLLDNPNVSAPEKIRSVAHRVGIGAGLGLALGSLGYLLISHRRAGSEADAVSLRVEGPFVRVTFGCLTHVDRKLHFRSIVDYSLVDGPLRRRLGLRTLVMTVPAVVSPGGPPGGSVLLTGVKDAERVRDELATLDAEREHLHV